jgi:hypothetical protein
MDQQQPAEMPPSIIASQGQQAQQQAQPQAGAGGGMADSLQKQTLGLAMQKLLEFKNVLEGLLTAMKAIDPESVALFIPALDSGKALEARLQAVMQRAGAQQPSMAGMQGGAGGAGPPGTGASQGSAMGM